MTYEVIILPRADERVRCYDVGKSKNETRESNFFAREICGFKMTLEIELGPELIDRLQCESVRRGQPVDSVVIHLLNEHLPQLNKHRNVDTLNQWAHESANLSAEEYASNLAVLRAIDVDRLSDRKLFEAISTRSGQP